MQQQGLCLLAGVIPQLGSLLLTEPEPRSVDLQLVSEPTLWKSEAIGPCEKMYLVPGWRENSRICHVCHCANENMDQFDSQAEWKLLGRLEHWQLMTRMLLKGKHVSSIFPALPGHHCRLPWESVL